MVVIKDYVYMTTMVGNMNWMKNNTSIVKFSSNP